MRSSFRSIYLGLLNRVRRQRSATRRNRARQNLASTQVLETRLLLSSLVADVLKGSTDTRITGTVYQDDDANGLRSNGENGIPNWRVYLDLDASGTYNQDAVGDWEPSALTNVDGDFLISKLVPGVYRIAEVVQPGWSPTATVSREVTVLNKKELKTDFFNFGGGSIEGVVWNDIDGDGTRAIDTETGLYTDPGLAGIPMFVDLDNNNELSAGDPQTVTDSLGYYRFDNLSPGDYEVYQVVPAGWEPTIGSDVHQTAGVSPLETTVQDFGDFGVSAGALSGILWNDLNFNGFRDVDPDTGAFVEPGLEGWTVFLDYDFNGVLDAGEPQALSDATGIYVFSSVLEGTYNVTENLPPDWNVSEEYSSVWTVDVFPGSTTEVPDFSNFTVLNGAISGTVWNDRFRDGARDVSPTGAYLDPGLAGWKVFLDRNRNLALDPDEPVATTDSTGHYLFTELQVGEYELREVVPTGWETTLGYGDNQSVFVYSGAETVARDFANFNLDTLVQAKVSGTVWSDLNGNGLREPAAGGGFSDPGLAGRTVFVDLNGNGLPDTGEPSATTASSGAYTLTGINPGTVTIVEVLPSGWSATSPTSPARTLTLRNGDVVSGIDFGNYARQEGVLSGRVFNDRNATGSRDTGEPGLAGLTVYLDTNNNGALDAGEPSVVTSEDKFFTPAIDETGTWEFTHLAAGTYTVRVQVPDNLSATPTAARSRSVTLDAAQVLTGLDTPAQYRRNEILGVRFSDDNANGVRDTGEAGVAGATVYLDLDRDDVLDADEPRTTTAADGSYHFSNLDSSAYVVRDIAGSGYDHTSPATVGGTLWPTGTSNPAQGDVSPTSIEAALARNASHRCDVSLTLPASGALTSMVDVFLLFDDTGSFVGNSPIVRAAFPDIITTLQSSLPGIDLGFGVGRFEEYGNFAYEYSAGRPFILNQPIVAASTSGYMTAIQAALNRTTPGYGGDGPETDIEALYQVVTGRGFDGNNNGSVLDSGAAGLVSTQLSPGASGDVPSFASFVADTANGVLPAAGTVGGVGFRSGALPIILTATDIGFAYQPKGETTVAGSGVTLPVSRLTGTSRPTTPFNAGAGLQETVTALNALGALVIGLGTNPQANVDPRQGLEALSLLTGAVNRSASTIANGTADPIATGDPLYFQISTGFASSVANGVVNAIQNAVTQVAVDVTLRASDPRVTIINHTGTRTAVGAGQTATFDVEFVGDGLPHRFDLQFVRAGSGVVLGSVPVVLGTPVPGSHYSFEDCREGEIHSSVDFGTQASSTGGGGGGGGTSGGGSTNAPTDLSLSQSSLAENSSVPTVIGTLTTTDADAGDTFTYSIVAGDTSRFEITGDSLRASAVADYEAQSQYSLTLRTTDSAGLTFDKTFTISITNVNETPSSVALSSSSIDENRPAGSVVGTLSTSDPDAGDTFSYSLLSGDTSLFAISGDQLTTTAAFNYESASSYSVTIRSTDAGGLVFDKTFTIGVNNVNEAPTLLSLTGDSLDETLAAGSRIGTLSTSDPDVGDTFTYTLVSGDTAAVEVVGNELRSRIVYDYETQTSYSVTVRTTDAAGLALDRLFTIRVLDRGGRPPALALPTTAVTYVENAAALLVNSTASVTDPDTANYGGGSLRVAYATGWNATDRLAIRHQGTTTGLVGLSGSSVLWGGVTVGSFSGGTATEPTLVIQWNSLATPTVVAGVLKNITFTVTGDSPSNAIRTLAFSLFDGVGESNTPVNRSVNVTPVNDLPIWSNGSAAAGAWVEGDPAVQVQPAVALFDVDSPDFSLGKFTVAFTSGQLTTDRITVLSQGTGAGEIFVSGTNIQYGGVTIGTFVGGFTTNASLVVTLNAAANAENVQSLARRIAFLNASDDPGSTTRVVSFTLADGDGGTSAALTRQIAVTPVNDAPVLTPSVGTTAFIENGVAKAVDAALAFVDADSPDLAGGLLTVALQSGGSVDDRLSILNGGTAAGKIGLSGTQVLYGGVALGTVAGGFTSNSDLVVTLNAGASRTAVAALVKNIAFQALGDNPSSTIRVVAFTLTDGDGGTSALVTKKVSVAPVNDAPTLATSAGTASYLENDPGVVIDPGLVVADVDSLDFSTGTLKVAFVSGSVTTDRLFLSAEGNGPGQVGIASNVVSVGGVAVGTFVASTTSNGALTITFNTAATPALVQAVARRVSFRNAGDNPTATTRVVSFIQTDGDGGTAATVTRSVTVTPVNDGPTIGSFGTGVTYTEGKTPTLLASAATVTDPDSTNFDGGVLTVSLPVGATADDLLEVKHTGTAAGQVGVAGTTISYGGLAIGTFTGGAAGTSLVVTFNASATATIVQAVVRAVQFRQTAAISANSTRTVRFTLTDGDGGSSLSLEKLLTVVNVA